VAYLSRLRPPNFVFGSKPEPRYLPGLRETDHCTADTTDKTMHDRTHKRTTFQTSGSAQSEPGEQFLFSRGPSDLLFQFRWQLVQGPWPGKRLAQLKDQFVTRERRVKCLRPGAFSQLSAGEVRYAAFTAAPGSSLSSTALTQACRTVLGSLADTGGTTRPSAHTSDS